MKSGILNLSSFNNAEVMDIDRGNGKERGIFIPIEDNCIYESKSKRTKCYIDIIEHKQNIYGMTHYIRVRATVKKARMLSEKGMRPPIIGHLGNMTAAKSVVPDDIAKNIK